MKDALSYSESMRIRLVGNDLLQTVKSLPPLTVPHKPAGPTGLVDFDLMSNKKHDELCQLMKESDKFTEVININSCHFFDLSTVFSRRTLII